MVLVVGAAVETVMKVEHVAVVVFLELFRVFINGVVTVLTVMVLILVLVITLFFGEFSELCRCIAILR